MRNSFEKNAIEQPYGVSCSYGIEKKTSRRDSRAHS